MLEKENKREYSCKIHQLVDNVQQRVQFALVFKPHKQQTETVNKLKQREYTKYPHN